MTGDPKHQIIDYEILHFISKHYQIHCHSLKQFYLVRLNWAMVVDSNVIGSMLSSEIDNQRDMLKKQLAISCTVPIMILRDSSTLSHTNNMITITAILVFKKAATAAISELSDFFPCDNSRKCLFIEIHGIISL